MYYFRVSATGQDEEEDKEDDDAKENELSDDEHEDPRGEVNVNGLDLGFGLMNGPTLPSWLAEGPNVNEDDTDDDDEDDDGPGKF